MIEKVWLPVYWVTVFGYNVEGRALVVLLGEKDAGHCIDTCKLW